MRNTLIPRSNPETLDRIPDLRSDLPEWHLRAACRGMDTELFFLQVGESKSKGAKAKAVCEDCPVQAECLEWAVVNFEPGGIWGGLSERERRDVRRGDVEEPPARVYGHQHHNSIPTRILDVLGFDEGWWTSAELAVRLATSENTVQVAMYRLRRRGLVENRDVELAGVEKSTRSYASRIGSATESRREWRAL